MQSINITEATGGWAVEFNLWIAELNVLGYEHSVLQPLTAAWVQGWQMSLPRAGEGDEWMKILHTIHGCQTAHF